jgi:hypothetical protein
MKKFKIYVQEAISDTFTIEAETMEEAMQIAEDKCADGEFLIKPQYPTCKMMIAEDDKNGETTEWVEF